MSSQDRKYFRFCFGLALLFLFISSAKTSSSPNLNCLGLAVNMMNSQTDDGDAFTSKFDKYLIQCLASVDWQWLNGYSIKYLQDLIVKQPTDKVESVREAFLRTSVFLIQSSYELYKRAVKFSESEKQHRGSLEELENNVKVLRNYITEKLNSKPENQDSTTMHKIIDEILVMVEEFYADLKQLTEDVKNDSIESQLDRGLIVMAEVTAITTCGGSIYHGGRVMSWLTCTIAIVGIPISIKSYYYSLGETYEKLNQTREDAKKLRLVLSQLRIELRITRASMEGSTAYVDIHILSGGCDDPGRSHVPNTCGFSYIEVNGKDFSPHSRGYNVVVVDGKTGKAVEARAFDTFGNSSSGDHLREYLNSLNGNKIVLVAIQEEGSKFMKSALDALKRLGATHPVMPHYQGSFALVGYAGENKPAWIAQKVAKGSLGPSEISLKIPLAFM